jgi:hypothetical protein
MTTTGADYAGKSPEGRPESVDEQVRRKGIRPVESIADLAQPGFSIPMRSLRSSSRTSMAPATPISPSGAGALRRPRHARGIAGD